ncbi:MAG: HAMP domain-containing histidine kinase [Oscillospiraceae bacterium]|nr:HAMP domain-containing histidine kinase [Oscillospiraceae bacterium]
MINNLRLKLIGATMLSLLIVLSVVVGVIAFSTYQGIIDDADAVLSLLADNGGSFPEKIDEFPSDSVVPGDDNIGAPGNSASRHQNDILESPELEYETRYFTVTFNIRSGNLVSVNTGKIAAVDSSSAVEYAEKVLAKDKTKGFIDDYRYLVYEGEIETTIVFLDCARNLSTFRTVITASLGISAVGLVMVLVLLIFLSGRIVKPFWENYEKQRRFITDAGHDLKTPLTVIGADAEVLEMDIGENEWITDIRNQVTRLTDMTNSLIMLSRMEEPEPQYQMIDFPLSDVVEEVLEEYRSLAKTHEKNLSGSIQPMISLHGDEKSIRRLLGVLLDNAMKYSDEHGTINLTLEQQRGTIRLMVFNTCPYMSKDSLPHLFDRFYRTDESRNSQTGGYGLGLSIAAAIVTAHKGKISAATSDEKSLLITITFPS